MAQLALKVQARIADRGEETTISHSMSQHAMCTEVPLDSSESSRHQACHTSQKGHIPAHVNTSKIMRSPGPNVFHWDIASGCHQSGMLILYHGCCTLNLVVARQAALRANRMPAKLGRSYFHSSDMLTS
eukprot:scpid98843/ scgid22243/ 